MNTSFTEETQAVIKAIQAKGNIFIDDHDPARKERGVSHLVVMDVFHRGSLKGQFVCPFYDYDYFTLNPIYLDKEGRPHLSTCSVGPCINVPRMLNRYNAEGLVREWNEEAEENLFGTKYLLTLVG